MKIHGTAKGGALSKKDFGVAFGGNGNGDTSQFLESYAVKGDISETNIAGDTFTGTGTTSTWGHYCSGIEASTATGYGVDGGTKKYFLGLVADQSGDGYCDAENVPLYLWNISDSNTATGCEGDTSCCNTITAAFTISSDTKYRLVADSDTIKYYLDVDGDDTWVLKHTYTNTGNIPTLYLSVNVNASGNVAVWSSE